MIIDSKLEFLFNSAFGLAGMNQCLGLAYLQKYLEVQDLEGLGLTAVVCADWLSGLIGILFIFKYFHSSFRLKILLTSIMLISLASLVQFLNPDSFFPGLVIERALSGLSFAFALISVTSLLISHNSLKADSKVSILQASYTSGLFISSIILLIPFLYTYKLLSLVVSSLSSLLFCSINSLSSEHSASDEYPKAQVSKASPVSNPSSPSSPSSPSIQTTPPHSLSLNIYSKPRLVIESLVQLVSMFTLSFIESLLEFNPEYIWTFKGGSFSIVNVFAFGFLVSALAAVPASKVFRHEGRAMCFGLFLTSLGLCLFSRSIYSYFPFFFTNYTTVEITALLFIGFGVGFTFIPSYSRIIKTANKHYCIEKTEDLMSQVSVTSCISVCAGRMTGTVAGIFIGNFINIDTGVLILAILINLAMIVYAFLTDVFNLFNEGLIDKLNDIEIVDLGAIYENELN